MRRLIFIVLSTFLSAFLLCGCGHDISYDDLETNKNLLTFGSFQVNSISTQLKTSTMGTVFITGTAKRPDHARIVARLVIDPGDWGGIEFSIPSSWRISAITSSYPDGELKKKPPEEVNVLTTAGEGEEFSARVRIGTHSTSPMEERTGGTGMVIIDLDLADNSQKTISMFKLNIAVGSDEKDGTRILFPDYETIEITIPQ